MASTTRAPGRELAQVDLTTTSATTVYTVPSTAPKGAHGLWIYVSNRTASAVALRLSFTKSGETDDATKTFGGGYDFSVPANNAQLPFYKKHLEVGDKIRAKAGTANAITLTVEGEEMAG